jgi:hypothetical protein
MKKIIVAVLTIIVVICVISCLDQNRAKGEKNTCQISRDDNPYFCSYVREYIPLNKLINITITCEGEGITYTKEIELEISNIDGSQKVDTIYNDHSGDSPYNMYLGAYNDISISVSKYRLNQVTNEILSHSNTTLLTCRQSYTIPINFSDYALCPNLNSKYPIKLGAIELLPAIEDLDIPQGENQVGKGRIYDWLSSSKSTVRQQYTQSVINNIKSMELMVPQITFREYDCPSSEMGKGIVDCKLRHKFF